MNVIYALVITMSVGGGQEVSYVAQDGITSIAVCRAYRDAYQKMLRAKGADAHVECYGRSPWGREMR